MWVPGRITFVRGFLSTQDNVTNLDWAFSSFHSHIKLLLHLFSVPLVLLLSQLMAFLAIIII
ncbi:hypothetical protein BpHYR1_022759 [Brachionus plicatilis]|uniref:Uncharacterized protein n=1 Tax=Brachionus plicatilis TaxID=10195 RepID=A0A3M7P7S7_BRAPC|nr:hypothetical protein BpHYR1_022759 [Brachionus plicatilis]